MVIRHVIYVILPFLVDRAVYNDKKNLAALYISSAPTLGCHAEYEFSEILWFDLKLGTVAHFPCFLF
jgi:hypothetical protein